MTFQFRRNRVNTALVDAYHWLCEKRAHHSPNSDVWHLRRKVSLSMAQSPAENASLSQTPRLKRLQQALTFGHYRFEAQQQYRIDHECFNLYRSQDSWVLKTLSLLLGDYCREHHKLSRGCVHIKGHGGLKSAVNQVQQALPEYQYVFKTDIKGYYESIDHDALCTEVQRLAGNATLTALIRDSISVSRTWGGLYYPRSRGIPRGSPLSPLLGAIALNPLDQAMMEYDDILYLRYMDDWVVLCKTKGRLRQVIKHTYRILHDLKLTLHPDKTFIGRIDKGFDFLGYHFTRQDLRLSLITLQRARDKLRQLYEQGASKQRLAHYLRQFWRWAKAAVTMTTPDDKAYYDSIPVGLCDPGPVKNTAA